MASFTVVEVLSTDTATVAIDGRTYPAPSLIEDGDGVRSLLFEATDPGVLDIHLWTRAHALGAAYLVAAYGTDFLVLTAERFMDTRAENRSLGAFAYTFDWNGWDYYPTVPSYRDLLFREHEVELALSTAEPNLGEFVHLHAHSEYSQLDGLSKVHEMAEAVIADGGRALAVTDHGVCASHPELQQVCDELGIKAIFGMEANFVPDRFRRGQSWTEVGEDGKEVKKSDSVEARAEYTHICLWAMDDEGLRNLWAMSTEAFREGFYDRPRLDWDTLARLNKGVMASTGCLRGPVAQALLKGDLDQARQNLARMIEIFGDRLVIEIHTNQLSEQILVNKQLMQMCRDYSVMPVAAVDSHYATPEDKQAHQVWLYMQQNKSLSDDTTLFAGGQDYHLKTTQEVRESLAYLGAEFAEECIRNTTLTAARCNARISGAITTPTFSKPSVEHPDPVRRDMERLIELCLRNWTRKIAGKKHSQEAYMARFEREMALLIEKQFCGYFLIVAEYVQAAKDAGILVGPGRGSGGGSLVAYLAGIVEIDPVDADLLFERFLSEGRTELPDFDIDFPASKRGWIKNWVRERWGEEYVVTIGTIGRLASKSAVDSAIRVLDESLPYRVDFVEIQTLKKAIDAADAPLAGKHMPWDEFRVEFADIVEPLIEKYPEIFVFVNKIMGRLKSYGKHAAGVVISTDRPLSDLPLRLGADGDMVTQFDMMALAALGYVKFDLLTLRTLDTVQMALDLVRERRQFAINVYEWREEYADPQVWDEVCDGRTLGLFQIETKAGTRLTKRFGPRSVHDLAAIMTLVRPGPVRSGLTETYLRRRDGVEPVSYPEPRLEVVLGETYGCIIYQEDIMQTCIVLGGYTGAEADAVRSILGKKKVEKIVPAGQQFVERSVGNGADPRVVENLWEQMAEFAKYSFNKAHAFGYAVLGYWTAWLKFHYPIEFLTAALSTVDADRIPDFVNEARRMGYAVLGPDINESKVSFSPTLMSVRYGLASVKQVGIETAAQIVSSQPYATLDDFVERALNGAVDRGHLAVLVQAGAFDSLIGNRRAIEMQIEAEKNGDTKRCAHMDLDFKNDWSLPCQFDWANEPDPPMVTRGRGANKVTQPKPPPKRCSVICRQYTKPAPMNVDLIAPYTDEEIRTKEKELLGTWLSSTPFDRLPEDVLLDCHTATEIDEGPQGQYTVAAIVEHVNMRKSKSGSQYAWVKLNIQGEVVDATCWSEVLNRHAKTLVPDALILAYVYKNDRGLNLTDLIAV